MYARDPGQTTATCRERYAYNPAGLNGKPTSAPLDSPVFGQIDAAGDGTFERSFLIIQNHLGDVIKIIGEGGFDEEIRYTLFGEPYIVNWCADVNHDGSVDGEDIIAFYTLWDIGAFDADSNQNGAVDGDDIIAFFAYWDNGDGAGRTLADNRFGFRGYVWDDHLKLYHVRHRVFDPTPGPAGMRWLQRDPAFFVDGLNLYAYCGGDPVNGVDPMGLFVGPEVDMIYPLLRIFYPEAADEVDRAAVTVIDYTSDTVQGAAELGSYWSQADSVDDVLTDASDGEARQDVHDALHTAREAASHVPIAGELAGHAVNIVDKGLGVWDECLDGEDPTISVGLLPNGGNLTTPAVDQLLKAVFEGVMDRSKGGKGPKAPKSKLKPDGPGPNGGLRDQKTTDRLKDQKKNRDMRREDASRASQPGPGNTKRSGEGYRDLKNARKGERGDRPEGPGGRERERNIGIDEEHSRVPKGTGGGQGRPR